MLYSSGGQQHPPTRQTIFIIGKYSILISDQGNAANKRQVNPLMHHTKMMRLLEKDNPQVYQKLLYKDLVDSRCNE